MTDYDNGCPWCYWSKVGVGTGWEVRHSCARDKNCPKNQKEFKAFLADGPPPDPKKPGEDGV